MNAYNSLVKDLAPKKFNKPSIIWVLFLLIIIGAGL